MSRLKILTEYRDLLAQDIPDELYNIDALFNELVKEHGLLTDEIREKILACNTCKEDKYKRVPGKGPLPCDLIFVGEGPGAVEDEQGEPFVGPAGQLLDSILVASQGLAEEKFPNVTELLNRKHIYITNIVKCRCVDGDGENTKPSTERIAHCSGFLKEELRLAQPKIVVCWGGPAASVLIHPDFKITKDHGQWFRSPDGYDMIAIYHPAYILWTKEPELVRQRKKDIWQDMQKVVERLSQLREGR